MTPEQAIEILDKIATLMRMNRSDHFNAQKAVETLKAFIKEEDKVPE